MLVRWASEEESRLEAALQGALEGCFDVSPAAPGGGATAALTLRESIAAAPTGPELPVAVLLQGLEDLAGITGRPTQTEVFLARLAKQVLRHFVAPFLESQGRVNIGASEAAASSAASAKPRVAFRLRDDGVVHAAELAPTDEQVDAVPALSDFLAFFASHSSLFPAQGSSDKPSKHAATLTAHLTPSLQSHVISSHLSPSLPASTSDLPAYLALVAAASAFESTFLPSHGLFAFLPSSLSSSSREVEEQRVIRTWAARVPQHWARQVGDRALARVRGAVKAWDWGAGETVEVDVVEEDEMLGLLLGLGLADEQLPAQGGATAAQQALKVPRELALATVPRGAQREMTIEEALAPKVLRAKTPPPPSPPAAPAQAPAPAPVDEPVQTPPPPPTGKGSLKRGKLGAARIAAPLPPRSPSPPALFQGGDAPARESAAAAASAPAAEPSPPSPPAPAPEPAHEPAAAPTIALVEASPAPEPHALDRSAVISPTLSPRGQHTTFELLEEPASTLDGIETTADHAREDEVGGVHSYAAAVDDGAEASPEQEEADEERDAPARVKVEEVEEAVPAADHDDALDPDAPAPSSGEERDDAFSPRHIKEESVEPEIPPTPSPGLSAPPPSHSPSLGLTYDEASPVLSDVEPLTAAVDERDGHDEAAGAAAADELAESAEAQPYAVDDEAVAHEPLPYEPSPYEPSLYEPSAYQPAPQDAAHDDAEPTYFDRSASPRDPYAPSSPLSRDEHSPPFPPPSHDPYAPHSSAVFEPDSHEEADYAAREQYGLDAAALDSYEPFHAEQGAYGAEHDQYAPVEAAQDDEQRFVEQDDPYALPGADVEQPMHSSYGDDEQHGAESQHVAAQESHSSAPAPTFPWSADEDDPYAEQQQDPYPPQPQDDGFDSHSAQVDQAEHDPYAPPPAPAHEPLEPAPASFSSLAAPPIDDEDPYADEAEHDWYAQEEQDWYAQEDQAFSPLEQPQPSYPVDAQQPDDSTQPATEHDHGVIEPAHDPYAPVEPVHDPYGESDYPHGVEPAHDPYAPSQPSRDPHTPSDSRTESIQTYDQEQQQHEVRPIPRSGLVGALADSTLAAARPVRSARCAPRLRLVLLRRAAVGARFPSAASRSRRDRGTGERRAAASSSSSRRCASSASCVRAPRRKATTRLCAAVRRRPVFVLVGVVFACTFRPGGTARDAVPAVGAAASHGHLAASRGAAARLRAHGPAHPALVARRAQPLHPRPLDPLVQQQPRPVPPLSPDLGPAQRRPRPEPHPAALRLAAADHGESLRPALDPALGTLRRRGLVPAGERPAVRRPVRHRLEQVDALGRLLRARPAAAVGAEPVAGGVRSAAPGAGVRVLLAAAAVVRRVRRRVRRAGRGPVRRGLVAAAAAAARVVWAAVQPVRLRAAGDAHARRRRSCVRLGLGPGRRAGRAGRGRGRAGSARPPPPRRRRPRRHGGRRRQPQRRRLGLRRRRRRRGGRLGLRRRRCAADAAVASSTQNRRAASADGPAPAARHAALPSRTCTCLARPDRPPAVPRLVRLDHLDRVFGRRALAVPPAVVRLHAEPRTPSARDRYRRRCRGRAGRAGR